MDIGLAQSVERADRPLVARNQERKGSAGEDGGQLAFAPVKWQGVPKSLFFKFSRQRDFVGLRFDHLCHMKEAGKLRLSGGLVADTPVAADL